MPTTVSRSREDGDRPFIMLNFQVDLKVEAEAEIVVYLVLCLCRFVLPYSDGDLLRPDIAASAPLLLRVAVVSSAYYFWEEEANEGRDLIRDMDHRDFDWQPEVFHPSHNEGQQRMKRCIGNDKAKEALEAHSSVCGAHQFGAKLYDCLKKIGSTNDVGTDGISIRDSRDDGSSTKDSGASGSSTRDSRANGSSTRDSGAYGGSTRDLGAYSSSTGGLGAGGACNSKDMGAQAYGSKGKPCRFLLPRREGGGVPTEACSSLGQQRNCRGEGAAAIGQAAGGAAASPSDPKMFPFILLGNKVDIDGGNSRVVSEKKAKEWCASRENIPYFETSAKEDYNVDAAFLCVAKTALAKEHQQDIYFQGIPDAVSENEQRGGVTVEDGPFSMEPIFFKKTQKEERIDLGWSVTVVLVAPLQGGLRRGGKKSSKRDGKLNTMFLISKISPPRNSLCVQTSFSSTSTSFVFPEISTCKTMRDLKQLHGRKIKTGRIRDPFAAAEILQFCAFSDYRNLEYAHLVFDKMEEPNCFSWNTLIRAFSESDEPLVALFLFYQMLHYEFVEPNRFTFPSVLKACALTVRIEEGKQVHGQIIKLGLNSDEFVLSNLVRMYVISGIMKDAHNLFNKSIKFDYSCSIDVDNSSKAIRDKRRQEGNVVLWNVMIDGYIRIGEFEAARQLFGEMPQRSVVSWNGMIAGYAQNGFFKEALEIFHEMQMSDVLPNYVTLVSVLPAISRLGGLDLGKWVHVYAEKNKIEIDDVLGSALIDMYSKCGSIEKALQVFERLPRKNVVTWSAVIGGLAMHGRAKDALDHFQKMERAGVMPSDVTYIGLLNACSHAGFVVEGRFYFDHMVRVVGLKPRIEHYGCMVDLLGRVGLLEEAEVLILNMPIKPDDVIWKALLSACKMHGNIEMGKRTAKRLMELAPRDSGCYVALSNIYASLGNWEAVAEVRLMMKEMAIRKDPGCSWIELDGMIHEFLVEDDSHPRAIEIRLMLEEIADRLSLVGYTPDTTQVLLNMDEEEKTSTLKYHSEKIAIAFGLISTNSHMPLRIVKNLRIGKMKLFILADEALTLSLQLAHILKIGITGSSLHYSMKALSSYDNPEAYVKIMHQGLQFPSVSGVANDLPLEGMSVAAKIWTQILERTASISEKKAKEWCASRENIPYIETSAKEDYNVDATFLCVAKTALAYEHQQDM
ncbi:hypothetical protein HHK36_030590 [Tetracentron sinense]|uniref:DYW domain-containing protein n=1 Tax=Tetracentron sinense TaxID=13715 RepID=A0A835D0T3_TETSI|nr:hypothetical protein HHK36_030590 [Tetracentron sinense]